MSKPDLELSVALWRCAVVLRRLKMRDVRGRLMWPNFVKLASQAAQVSIVD